MTLIFHRRLTTVSQSHQSARLDPWENPGLVDLNMPGLSKQSLTIAALLLAGPVFSE